MIDSLRAFARTPVILVACDYDGTLAPIVDNPDEARPLRESIAALRTLAAMPDTHVAVISGRSLRDLAALSRLPEEIHLIGSHGSEFDAGFVHALNHAQLERRDEIATALGEIAQGHPGFIVERKPASVALHYRQVPVALHEQAVDDAVAGAGSLEGVVVKPGKMVIELAVVETDKGTALTDLRHLIGVEAVLFAGDDITDEDAFERLTGPDLGVKIGPGESAAIARVSDPDAFSHLLARLCELRRAWLEGDTAPAIERHSLLSDQRTLALVTPDARITWLCHPRADSPAVFAELLGGPRAGYFSVRPDSAARPISQRYLPDTMVLETRWSDLIVTDYLDCAAARTREPAGRTDLLRVLEGRGPVIIEYAPRPDYGRAFTRLTLSGDSVIVRGAQHVIELRAQGVSWEIIDAGPHESAVGHVELDGQSLALELIFDAHVDRPTELDEADRRRGTVEHWSRWAERLVLPTVATNEVRRSALVLKALCYEPTGAIYAAATTSLPEELGGVRNWDYRYCWPRDASLSAAALVELGAVDEAKALLAWLLDRVDHLPGPDQLRPLYAVEGDEFLPEAVLPTLNGYRGSRPVRIGNAADSQVQLDVFGPVVDLIWRLVARGEPLEDAHWQLVIDMVAAVRARWFEPDNGIWEERRAQRHHVHSKVMCWQAVDRAVRVGHASGRAVPASWRPLRHLIAADVIENGWNDRVRAYTIAYGDDYLDASVLHIGLSGLLPPTDSRFVATVRGIERKLRNGPIVYRYRFDDGLPGDEGGFLICSAWLIEAYVLMGQLADARQLFKGMVDRIGPTGLLSEQYEPRNETMLGNHPQAYSHLGLILAALAVERGMASTGG
ncbi:MAG: trehalose-phosphatase [Acidimicrobiia bacterium]|nr:trehalose-phosphatase [Acidimicrobiia bacterium]